MNKSNRWLGVLLLAGLLCCRPVPADDTDRPDDPADTRPVRLLVWAHPGQSGQALEKGNWLEYDSLQDYAAGRPGRPAGRLPDRRTDLLLPDAPPGRAYIVGCFNGGRRNDAYNEPPALTCRHLDIGRGAALDGGAGWVRGKTIFSGHPDLDATFEIHGNVHVRQGGCLYGQLALAGSMSTTLVIDDSPELLCTDLTVRKSGQAAVVVKARRLDLVQGIDVRSGRLVLDAGCRLGYSATRQARRQLGKLAERLSGEIAKADLKENYVRVRPGATLELRPGSWLGRLVAPRNLSADVCIEGLLHISSSPVQDDRPATIALTISKGSGRYLEQPGGLYLCRTARLVNEGRLVLTAFNPEPTGPGKGIMVFIEGPVEWGRVSFDYLRAGGLVCPDPASLADRLGSAQFGPHCAARGDDLLARLDRIDFQGGMGTVEFVDGLRTECEILYPLAGRLIVRSRGRRIAQSFDLKTVSAVVIGDRRIDFHPRRRLTEPEQEERRLNALWADVPGPGQLGKYGRQVWPEAPLLVWARPGRSGSRFVGPNWLDEKGRPLFESPLDIEADIDLLLPAAERYYTVSGFGPGGMSRPVPCRHLTVERNAEYGSSFNIRGNLWMKHGSGIHGRQMGAFNNDQPHLHRFMRFDGKRLARNSKDHDQLLDSRDYTASQWGSYQTGPDGTLEVIGQIRGAADHAHVSGPGWLVVSENSYLTDGERSAFAIHPGATVVLLPDARIGHETTMQQDICKASVWVGGTLMIGLPDRPIRHDMLFPLAGVLPQCINRDPPENHRTAGVSFLLGRAGRLLLYSADPTRARLVFKMHDSDKARQRGQRYGRPPGIVLYFAGQARLDGVVFDDVLEQGLMVPASVRATWKNIFFGPHNLAEPDRLFWDLKMPPAEEDSP